MKLGKRILAVVTTACLAVGLIGCGNDDAASDSTRAAVEVSGGSSDSSRMAFSYDAVTPPTDADGRVAIAAYDFKARDSRGEAVTRFDRPVTITIRYGVLRFEGEAATLTVVYFNPETNRYEDVETIIDTASETLQANVSHFSTYGVAKRSASGSGSVAVNGTQVAQGSGTVTGGEVSKDGTPIGAGVTGSGQASGPRGGSAQGSGGAAVKYDTTTALNVFSQQVYGRTFSYTDTGGAAAAGIASGSFPQNDKNLVSANIGAAGVAAYGSMSNGGEVVLAAVGAAVTNDAAADIAATGLADVYMTGFAAPANQQGALDLVRQVAPKIGSLGWTVSDASATTYVFVASGSMQITTNSGSATTNVGAVATVTTTRDGNTIVSVLVGTGTQATAVR